MNDSALKTAAKPIEELDSVVVRFAGDSGDGMQLAGTQLTNTSALAGNDVATFRTFRRRFARPREPWPEYRASRSTSPRATSIRRETWSMSWSR